MHVGVGQGKIKVPWCETSVTKMKNPPLKNSTWTTNVAMSGELHSPKTVGNENFSF